MVKFALMQSQAATDSAAAGNFFCSRAVVTGKAATGLTLH
jgi:hypothetical protein